MDLNLFTNWFDLTMRNVFEPSLNWVLSHPIISVLAVFFLLYIANKNYRML